MVRPQGHTRCDVFEKVQIHSALDQLFPKELAWAFMGKSLGMEMGGTCGIGLYCEAGSLQHYLQDLGQLGHGWRHQTEQSDMS